MLERYALPNQIDSEREFVPARSWWKFTTHFNVAHPQYVPAIRLHDRETEGVMMRWGFIPASDEGKPTEDPATCISAEQVDRSEGHRGPWLASQRCILPMAGYYLWQPTRARYRQPYFIRLIDRSAFGVAAIWDTSTSEEDDVIESCAVITVHSNPLVAEIFGGIPRMPAILRRKDYRTWLSGTPVAAKAVLQTYPREWMEAYPVSPRVNSLQHNDRSLIQPIALTG